MKKIFLIFILIASSLYADVAKVVALKGKAFITRAGKTIQVTRSTILERKDILITKSNSKVQLLFKDETIISVGKNSQLNIDEYVFDEKKDVQAEFSMVKGMFRTITGKIGKIKPKNFKLKTKTASIGIRGTQIVTDISAKQERIFCTEGQIEITNNLNNSSIIVNEGEFVSIDILSNLNKVFEINKTKQKDISPVNKNIKLGQNTIIQEEDNEISLKSEEIEPIQKVNIENQEKITQEENNEISSSTEEIELIEEVIKIVPKKETKKETKKEEDARKKAEEDAIKKVKVQEGLEEAKENEAKAKKLEDEAKREAKERRIAEQKAAKDAADKLAADKKLAAQKAEDEKIAAQLAAEKKDKEEKLAAKKAEEEKLAAQIEADKKAEELRLAQEKADAENTAEAKAEALRIKQEKEEADRIAQEKEEANRIAEENARIAAEQKAIADEEARVAAEEKAIADEEARIAAEEKAIAEEEARIAKEEADEAARIAAEAAQAALLADLSKKTEKDYIKNSSSTASYIGNFNSEPYDNKSQYLEVKKNKIQIPEGTKISMDIDFGAKKDHIKNGKIDFNGHKDMNFKGKIEKDSKIKLEGTNDTEGKGEAYFYGSEANSIKGNVDFHDHKTHELKIKGDFQADKYNEENNDSFDLTHVTDKDFIKQDKSIASYHGNFNGKDFNDKNQYLKYLGKNREIPSYVTIDMDIDFGAKKDQIQNGKINFLILKDLEFKGDIKDSNFNLKGTNGTKGSGSGKFYGNEANLMKGSIDMENENKNKLKGDFEAIK